MLCVTITIGVGALQVLHQLFDLSTSPPDRAPSTVIHQQHFRLDGEARAMHKRCCCPADSARPD